MANSIVTTFHTIFSRSVDMRVIRITALLFSLISLLVLSSCATIKSTTKFNNQVELSSMNRYQIDGVYSVGSIPARDNSVQDLSWFIFDRDAFKNDTIDRIAIASINEQQLLVAQYNDTNIVRTQIMQGKFKEGYFHFKRKSAFIPALIVNVFRNRKCRIGLLENGNIIADYKQVSVGTIWFIIPAYETVKHHSIEFERVDSLRRSLPQPVN